jgi:uncharacterized protein YdhG (YjbR/CyaY superfamily)
VDDAVRAYIAAIPPQHRALFDRVAGLIADVHPDVSVGISYQMPTYRVGDRRLYVGVWKHGISFYGWGQGEDGGFLDRHPELRSGRGTIRLRPDDAAAIPDTELRDLIRAALG